MASALGEGERGQKDKRKEGLERGKDSPLTSTAVQLQPEHLDEKQESTQWPASSQLGQVPFCILL